MAIGSRVLVAVLPLASALQQMSCRHHMVHRCIPSIHWRSTAPLLSASDDEVERAQRRRDEQAKRSEQEGGSDMLDEDSMSMLRERMTMLETKESQLADIRVQLRSMEPALGLRFVGDDDEILASAWVFVAVNILLALYALKILVVDPAVRTTGGLF